MAVTKQLLSINDFAGVNQSAPHSLIQDNEAILIGNMQIDNGVLKKRYGFKKVTDNGALSNLYQDNYVVYKNYLWVLIKTDDNKIEIQYFNFNGDFENKSFKIDEPFNDKTSKLVCFNNDVFVYCNYKVYKLVDGVFKTVEPYEPTVLTTCNIEGSGQFLEDLNLLTGKCKAEYSIPNDPPGLIKFPDSIFVKDSNGDKIYPWYYYIECNGEILEYETDYTVSRWTNKIPANMYITEEGKKKLTKGTNNLIIHLSLYPTDTTIQLSKDRYDKVSKCKIYTNYGGDNDNRILFSGNTEAPNTIYRSGVLDPTYFPENSYQMVGDSNEAITGFGKQYDCCLVFKESSTWRMEFNITSAGKVSYPVKPLNDTFGCDVVNGVENIDNNTVFLNKNNGVFRVYQSNQRGEANVGCVSTSINRIRINGYPLDSLQELPELAKYTGLIECLKFKDTIPSMCDDGEKLYISAKNQIFVYNYKLKSWYIWNVMNKIINKILCINNKILVVCGFELYQLKKIEEYPLTDKNNSINIYMDEYNENQEPIKSIWISKQFDFSMNERKKTVDRIFVEMQSLPRNSIEVFSLNRDNKLIKLSEKINDLYAYNRFSYDRATYNITPFPRELVIKYKAKKIDYFQLVFYNEEPKCASDVQSFDIRFKYNNYIK